MTVIRKIWNVIMKLTEYVIVFGLVMISIVLLYQVISRYVFNSPLVWSEELSLFLMTWICFFGVSYGVRHRMHVRMSTLVKLFPINAQKAIAVLVDLVCIAAVCFVIPTAWSYFIKQCAITSPGLQISYGFVTVCLPIGFVTLILSFIDDIIRIWKGDLPTD